MNTKLLVTFRFELSEVTVVRGSSICCARCLLLEIFTIIIHHCYFVITHNPYTASRKVFGSVSFMLPCRLRRLISSWVHSKRWVDLTYDGLIIILSSLCGSVHRPTTLGCLYHDDIVSSKMITYASNDHIINITTSGL